MHRIHGIADDRDVTHRLYSPTSAVIHVDDGMPELRSLKQHGFCLLVSLHVTVVIHVVASQIGECCHADTHVAKPILMQTDRGCLQDNKLRTRLGKPGQMTMHSHHIGGCQHARIQTAIWIRASQRSNHPCGVAISQQRLCDPLRAGCFAVCAGDRHHGQSFRGCPIPGIRQLTEPVLETLHHNHGQASRRQPVDFAFCVDVADDEGRIHRLSLCHEIAPIPLQPRHSQKHIACIDLPGVQVKIHGSWRLITQRLDDRTCALIA